jgi:hypothetical protein
MSEYDLPSGAKLHVTPLDFSEAFAVFQQVAKIIGLIEVDLQGIELGKDFMAQDLMKFKRPLTQLLSNSDIEKAGKQCLKKCTYDGLKIDDRTWNAVEARKDYLFAIFFALKENCSPFLAGVLSDSKV